MPGQHGYEAITNDDLYQVRICPRGDQWVVTIRSKGTLSPAETGLDTHEHMVASLESAKEWVAEQLARIWLPALEERHDLLQYEDINWTPVDC
jgi:hypothetical protein